MQFTSHFVVLDCCLAGITVITRVVHLLNKHRLQDDLKGCKQLSTHMRVLDCCLAGITAIACFVHQLTNISQASGRIDRLYTIHGTFLCILDDCCLAGITPITSVMHQLTNMLEAPEPLKICMQFMTYIRLLGCYRAGITVVTCFVNQLTNILQTFISAGLLSDWHSSNYRTCIHIE